MRERRHGNKEDGDRGQDLDQGEGIEELSAGLSGLDPSVMRGCCRDVLKKL